MKNMSAFISLVLILFASECAESVEDLKSNIVEEVHDKVAVQDDPFLGNWEGYYFDTQKPTTKNPTRIEISNQTIHYWQQWDMVDYTIPFKITAKGELSFLTPSGRKIYLIKKGAELHGRRDDTEKWEWIYKPEQKPDKEKIKPFLGIWDGEWILPRAAKFDRVYFKTQLIVKEDGWALYKHVNHTINKEHKYTINSETLSFITTDGKVFEFKLNRDGMLQGTTADFGWVCQLQKVNYSELPEPTDSKVPIKHFKGKWQGQWEGQGLDDSGDSKKLDLDIIDGGILRYQYAKRSNEYQYILKGDTLSFTTRIGKIFEFRLISEDKMKGIWKDQNWSCVLKRAN